MASGEINALTKKKAAKKVGAPNTFADSRHVLNSDTIGTPEHWHAQMTFDAIKALDIV